MSSNYYISDLHLGHYRAFGFDNRPFKSLEEQDDIIINNINDTVGEDSNLYLLGDISWYDGKKTEELLQQIKCKNLFLIVGNHDKRWMGNINYKRYFKGVYDLLTVNDNTRKVVLCHYPIAVWNLSHRNSYHLYGHVHNNLTEDRSENRHKILLHEEMENAFNVGCMRPWMNYKPRTLNYLIKKRKDMEKEKISHV